MELKVRVQPPRVPVGWVKPTTLRSLLRRKFIEFSKYAKSPSPTTPDVEVWWWDCTKKITKKRKSPFALTISKAYTCKCGHSSDYFYECPACGKAREVHQGFRISRTIDTFRTQDIAEEMRGHPDPVRLRMMDEKFGVADYRLVENFIARPHEKHLRYMDTGAVDSPNGSIADMEYKSNKYRHQRGRRRKRLYRVEYFAGKPNPFRGKITVWPQNTRLKPYTLPLPPKGSVIAGLETVPLERQRIAWVVPLLGPDDIVDHADYLMFVGQAFDVRGISIGYVLLSVWEPPVTKRSAEDRKKSIHTLHATMTVAHLTPLEQKHEVVTAIFGAKLEAHA